MIACVACLMLGRPLDPDALIVMIGGYSVCVDHVAPMTAVVDGRDWPAFLVEAWKVAREAQNDPRPPGAR